MPFKPISPRDAHDLTRFHKDTYLLAVNRNLSERAMSPARARAHAMATAQAEVEAAKRQLAQDSYTPSSR